MPDLVVEGDVPEQFLEDDGVLVKDSVGAVVELVAAVVTETEEAVCSEEVSVFAAHRTLAGVFWIVDPVGACDARKPSLTGCVLGCESSKASVLESLHSFFARMFGGGRTIRDLVRARHVVDQAVNPDPCSVKAMGQAAPLRPDRRKA